MSNTEVTWEKRRAWLPTMVGGKLIWWGREYEALPMPMYPTEELRRLPGRA